MDGIRCFWLERTHEARASLRRYRSSFPQEGKPELPDDRCPNGGAFGLHNAQTPIGTRAIEWVRRAGTPDYWACQLLEEEHPPHEDPRWPRACSCGYVFREDDTWQLFWETIYRRHDTGELYVLREAPPGAMWNCDWLPESWHGADGRSLCVRTPGGDWNIDSRASNCGLPDDRVHRCWIRHGEPPDLTVDKNGVTCNAGGGSILAGSYHGFLRGGYLVPA